MERPVSHSFDVRHVAERLAAGSGGYEIVHETPGVEVGVYVLVAPEPDRQQPHDDDEVYVVSVSASGHPTLVVVCDPSVLGASLDATRRIDALAAVAGQALERIVLRRKRGG